MTMTTSACHLSQLMNLQFLNPMLWLIPRQLHVCTMTSQCLLMLHTLIPLIARDIHLTRPHAMYMAHTMTHRSSNPQISGTSACAGHTTDTHENVSGSACSQQLASMGAQPRASHTSTPEGPSHTLANEGDYMYIHSDTIQHGTHSHLTDSDLLQCYWLNSSDPSGAPVTPHWSSTQSHHFQSV